MPRFALLLATIVVLLSTATPAVAAPDEQWHRVDFTVQVFHTDPDCLTTLLDRIYSGTTNCRLYQADMQSKASPFADGTRVQAGGFPDGGTYASLTLWTGGAGVSGRIWGQEYSVTAYPTLTKDGSVLMDSDDSKRAGERGGPLRVVLNPGPSMTVSGWLRTTSPAPAWLSCPSPSMPGDDWYRLTCQADGNPAPTLKVVEGSLPDGLSLGGLRDGEFSIQGRPEDYMLGTTVTIEAKNRNGSARQRLVFPDRPNTGTPIQNTSVELQIRPLQGLQGDDVQMRASVQFERPYRVFAIPTGAVQFLADDVPLGRPVNLRNGDATLSWSQLSPGLHAITARYLPTSKYIGSEDTVRDIEIVSWDDWF